MSELLGADRLIAKCRRLASKKAGEDIVLRAVHNATKKVVQADAKRLAPGNNGELRNSIKTRVKMDGDKAIGEVYTNLHYAPYVEFGTGPKGQASHSGISPEVSVSYRSSPWYVHEDQIDIGPYHFQKIGEFYKMYGQPAQPYLYPALRDNQERVSKNISNYVRRKIREQIK
nr:MAG TPA: putative tail component [Caudoviricetes sp.]